MKTTRIEVSIDRQELTLFSRGRILRTWPVSTAAKGVGFTGGSHRTPTGRFVIRAKIGAKADRNTIFRGRRPAGLWDGSHDSSDLILSRILRLGGLDGENANTFDRYIYIHGTNHEDLLGEPTSCGCIRMSRDGVIDLFSRVPSGTEVIIHPPEQRRGKLIFFDCDSTLSSIEGIDELARSAGRKVFREIEDLTRAAMNGDIPLDEVFPRRMLSLAPNRDSCEYVARQYLATITPGAAEFIRDLRLNGWTIVILSGGFEPLIRPLADRLGVRYVEAVPLYFDHSGTYRGYGSDYPTTRNGGKPEIIREWRQAMLPEKVVMIGDGISDLETRTVCDLFIGYGGVVERAAVKRGADQWVSNFRNLDAGILDKWLDKSPLNFMTRSIIYGLHKSIAGDTAVLAMSSKTNKAGKKTNKGKRYSQAEKQQILDFVTEVNTAKGRGGQAAASKKYGISPLTISSWIKSGGAPPKKPGRKPGRKPGKKTAAASAESTATSTPAPAPAPAAAARATAPTGSLEQKLDKLKTLAKRIDSAEAELKQLQNQFDSLKGSL